MNKEKDCKWHKDDSPAELTIGCQECGTLLWTIDCPSCGKTFLDWEAQGHDDVCSAPYVTEDGDLVCYTCLKTYEQSIANEIDNDPDCYDYDYADFGDVA